MYLIIVMMVFGWKIILRRFFFLVTAKLCFRAFAIMHLVRPTGPISGEGRFLICYHIAFPFFLFLSSFLTWMCLILALHILLTDFYSSISTLYFFFLIRKFITS